MLRITKVFKTGTSLLILLALTTAGAQTVNQLQDQVAQLERELAKAKLELQEAVSKQEQAQTELDETKATLASAADTGPSKIELQGPFGGTWKIGGALRANYLVGDYTDPNPGVGGTRGDSGTISLDVFRINVDYENGNFTGKFEYRFYPGYRGSNQDSYQFPHTAWLGYNLQNGAQVQAGINRVPFGPGAWGISQSWFFDQHFYLGLADDMDFGIKYSTTVGDVKLDLAYYISDEGSWTGEFFSSDSVRYSYDVVNESGSGYEERNQLNLRLRKPVVLAEGVTSEVGLSLQYGELESKGQQEDGDHYAVSLHAVTSVDNWKLATQLTRYAYDVDANQPLSTDTLVQFGAYDFATLVAAKAWVAGVSLSYYLETNGLPWLDYVIPYWEYSSIIKDESSFNNSDLITLGAAWGRGGWYIYSEFAWSNGNDFVGNLGGYGDSGPADLNSRFASNRFGANPDKDWQYRFNLNFGYYF
jgi:hypothetical protein